MVMNLEDSKPKDHVGPPRKGSGKTKPEPPPPDHVEIGKRDETPTILPDQIQDPKLAAAAARIMNARKGAADPFRLLGIAHVRIAELEETLNVAIGELTRLHTEISQKAVSQGN